MTHVSAEEESWKKEKLEFEEKIRTISKLDSKNIVLQDKLKDAEEAVVRFQLELQTYKELWRKEKYDLEEKLKVANVYESKYFDLQDQLKDAQETIVKFQLELENLKMEKMSNEFLKWQEETDQLNAQPELSLENDSLRITITQLQAALSVERTQRKNLTRDKDVLLRENMDLKRQVKEVETIIKRRSLTDSALGSVVGDSKLKDLENELKARQTALSSMQLQLEDMQTKYGDHICELERRLKKSQQENNMLKHQLDELNQREEITSSNPIIKRSLAIASTSTARSTNCAGGAPSGSNKEDAHLLATIRGMQLELAKKDKDIMKLNRELDDARKTNRRLQREREKQLKTTAGPQKSALQTNSVKTDTKSTAVVDDELGLPMCERPYNQAMYNEQEESMALMKMENKSLREELQRLGQDIVTLHSKRLQDLRNLQSEHEQEIERLLNDYSSRHSQSTVADLQGQIYTQQMVISHLKEQLKQVTELKEENAMLKLERDHLEKTVMTTKKRLQGLQTPESQQYQSLLQKFENLEQRHEVREQKLQSIVRDLLARSAESIPCGSVCRNKLLDKNREICYYRVEMDRILEALREFKRSK